MQEEKIKRKPLGEQFKVSKFSHINIKEERNGGNVRRSSAGDPVP